MPFRTKEINEKKQILLYGGAHPFIFDLKEIGDYRKYKVNKIVLGSNHGLVMFNNLNELGVFGSNQSGELGLPYKVNEMNFYDKLVLNKMKFLGMEDFKVIDIAAGENFSMVLIKFNNKKFPSLYKFHLNQTESNEVIHLEECETQAAIKKILVSSLRTILLTEDNSLYVKGNLFSLDISEKYKQIVKFDCNVTDLGMGNNDCLILLGRNTFNFNRR